MLVAKLGDMNKAKANERIRELLHTLGLNHRKNAYPDKLSGGEQERAIPQDGPILAVAISRRIFGLYVPFYRPLSLRRGEL